MYTYRYRLNIMEILNYKMSYTRNHTLVSPHLFVYGIDAYIYIFPYNWPNRINNV